jgi:hypothetical protein
MTVPKLPRDAGHGTEKENIAMIPSNNPAAAPAAHDVKPSRVPTKRAEKAATKGKAKAAKLTHTFRHGSKTAKIIALLKRPGGAALEQLQKATGWQAHSVRGFLSGSLKRRWGYESFRPNYPMALARTASFPSNLDAASLLKTDRRRCSCHRSKAPYP